MRGKTIGTQHDTTEIVILSAQCQIIGTVSNYWLKLLAEHSLALVPSVLLQRPVSTQHSASMLCKLPVEVVAIMVPHLADYCDVLECDVHETLFQPGVCVWVCVCVWVGVGVCVCALNPKP